MSGITLTKTLDTIDDISKKTLYFLKYSTQVRNIAYLIQLNQALSQVGFDKGLQVIYQLNLLRLRADILEGLLYCSLKEGGIPIVTVGPKSRGKFPGLYAYANSAKKNKLISKALCSDIHIIARHRNDLHPSRQNNLHLKISPEVLSMSDTVVIRTTSELELAKIFDYF